MTVGEILALAHRRGPRGLPNLSLGYPLGWGRDELRAAIAATYETVDAEHMLAFSGAEEAIFWAMEELARPGRPRHRHRAQLPVDGVGADRHRRRRHAGVMLDPRTTGPSTSTTCEGRCARTPADRRQLPQQPHRGDARRGDVPRPRRALRRARHPALQRRGLPRPRGRGLEAAAAGRRHLADGALAERHVQGVRPLRPAHRLGRLPGPRDLLERLERASTTRRICNAGPSELLATIVLRNADEVRARNRRSSPRTCRCSASSSSNAGATCSSGSARRAAASRSRATWGRRAPRTSATSCSSRRASACCRRASTSRRSAEVPTDRFRMGVGHRVSGAALEVFDDFLRDGTPRDEPEGGTMSARPTPHTRKGGDTHGARTRKRREPGGVRILHEQEVRDLIGVAEALEAVRDAFARMGRGETMVPPVMIICVPENDGEVHIKAAHLHARRSLRREVRLDLRAQPRPGPAGGLRSGPRVQRRDRLPERHAARQRVPDRPAYRRGRRPGRRPAGQEETSSRSPIIGAGIQGRFQLEALLGVRAAAARRASATGTAAAAKPTRPR